MKTSSPWLFIALASTLGASLLTGCDSSKVGGGEAYYIGVRRAPEGAAMQKAAEPAEKVDRTAETEYTQGGLTFDGTELAFPTGDKRTSTILLRQSAPSEMRVGQEYEYTIDVINLTKGDLQNVVVNSENFSNITYISSTPPFTKVGQDDLAWLIGDLPAGATKTIKVKAKANALGTATNCLSVSYANVLCIATNVVQPALQLTKTATPELCGTCDEVKLTYEVKNTGTGVAEKTVIKDTLPAGLTTVDGKSVVELNAGDVAAGASKPFTVMAKAAKSGTFSSAATATAYPGLTAQSASPTTVVKQPNLTVTCDASSKVFVGRDITYKFTVKNTGDCPASNASIKAPIPANTTFVSADNGGRVEGGNVVWSMASVAAGQTATVSMKVKPNGIGNAPITATAMATCVQPATTNCATAVEGIPAILLEVVDTIDPVEVGGETTFVATVTNQGSADDDDIRIVLTLPAEMEFVSCDGPGPKATVNGKTVNLGPVSDLFPQQKAVWTIRVKATGSGDVRSQWSMTSKQFTKPILETESTTLFK
ncbi:MAG: DUF11 domain-containing protein [Phycisphaerae bacterium]|nr:DUF11 domain-containing protein [Phycisphaerae bacterium]